MSFALSATTVFVFRRRAALNLMKSNTGFTIPGHPVTTVLFVAVCWWVVGNTIYRYPQNSLIGFGLLLMGVPVYWFWSRRALKQSASK